VDQTHAGLAPNLRRVPRRLLLPLLGAILLVLLSPERAHAAVRPAPVAAAAHNAAMRAETAETPAARLLAAVRSLPLASLLVMAKPHQGEGTAVLSTSPHRGTRTAVLSSTPPDGLGLDLGMLVAGLTLVLLSRARRAHPEHSGTRTRSYEPLVSPA